MSLRGSETTVAIFPGRNKKHHPGRFTPRVLASSRWYLTTFGMTLVVFALFIILNSLFINPVFAAGTKGTGQACDPLSDECLSGLKCQEALQDGGGMQAGNNYCFADKCPDSYYPEESPLPNSCIHKYGGAGSYDPSNPKADANGCVYNYESVNASFCQNGSSPNPSLGPEPAGLADLQGLVKRIIQLSVGAAFIALVVVLTIAGIKFLTSGGEAKPIQSASQAVTWALLGMLFLVIAWLVLQLIHAFTGIDVTKFCIGFTKCGGP